MPEFTAKDVKALRDTTGAGMMDAKRALEANDGDMDAAGKWLREQGIVKSAGRSDRENAQGAVAVASNDIASAIVELKSETDFTAKSEAFTSMVQQLADAVLAGGEGAIDAHKDAIDDLKITTKENIEIGKVARIEARNGNVLDTYLHRQDGRGVNGVVVELSGGTAETAHAVALHAAFAKPRYLSRDEIPVEAIKAERATLEAITRAEGKPEQAVPKIVEGRVNAWIADQVLLEQKMIPDEKQPVAQAIGDATVERFVQAVIGA
ncbi:MAG TPA: translation elongation factor Ts [Acidimicrobiales bacterium]